MNKLVFLPHSQHLIIADSCRFRLDTYVNGYIISTKGEYIPKISDGEFKSQFQEVGYDRLYETMVFKAMKRKGKENQCCPWEIADHGELMMRPYNDAVSAFKGHYDICEEYSK